MQITENEWWESAAWAEPLDNNCADQRHGKVGMAQPTAFIIAGPQWPLGHEFPTGGRNFSNRLKTALPAELGFPAQGLASSTGFCVHQPPHLMQKKTPLNQARQ